MQPHSLDATHPSPRQAPLAAVRAAVLARRVKASPSVAALLGELCFGAADRGPAADIPVLLTGAR